MARENKINYKQDSVLWRRTIISQACFNKIRGLCAERRGTLSYYKQICGSCITASQCIRTPYEICAITVWRSVPNILEQLVTAFPQCTLYLAAAAAALAR